MHQDISSFDFIIVGAGSAGCILAERLSADGISSVLVLEFGGLDDHWLINLPLGVAKTWEKAELNWGYESEPEPGLNGRRLSHPRGKIVGGSGSLNIMAFVRGHRDDFDRWARAGMRQWSYSHVLPYFKRLEAYSEGANAYRGGQGFIDVTPLQFADPLVGAWKDAGSRLGIPWNEDYNGADLEGFSMVQCNIAEARRKSSGTTYMRKARIRKNVELRLHALVGRIILKDGRAIGAEYEKDGQTCQAFANREVILCAGAYNSPKLLMLSGIGPAAQLRAHGIEVKHHHPSVGQNLQDHPGIDLEFELLGKSLFRPEIRYDQLLVNVLRGWFLRSGPAGIPPAFCTGFVRSREQEVIPDLQLFFGRFSYSSHPWFPIIKPPYPNRLSFVAYVLRPEARGSVELKSGDPRDAPLIRNNFLNHQEDLDTLRRGVTLIRTLAAQTAFEGRCGPEVIPGAQVQSTEELDHFIRENSRTIYHPCGTCRMGADKDSVVDPDLKLRGVQNLRIVDASVMPDITSGNINAPVMMIAEKASDLIRGIDPYSPEWH